MRIRDRIRDQLAKLPARQRQYFNLALLFGGGVCLLWAVMAFSGDDDEPKKKPLAMSRDVKTTNISMPKTVPAIDAWVGTAGKQLATYEAERAAQQRTNHEHAQATAKLLERIGELEKKQGGAGMPAETLMPPAAPPGSGADGIPPGVPGAPGASGAHARLPAPAPEPLEPPLMQVVLPEGPKPPEPPPRPTVSTYLPVSFMRGVLLGGMDAHTGSQAQGNPLPVLIELSSHAFLPNGHRSQVKRCYVIGSGYGDLASERAYIRTVSLSCVRHDGSTLEVNLKGNVLGEDGKQGLRGRMVSKQGQLLANALRAGIVGGIGQGFSNSGTTYTSSALGDIASRSNGTSAQMKRGLSSGFGSAMDTLANYYIKMAEAMYPVIEIDAGRQVEVMLTSGVSLGAPIAAPADDDTPVGASR